MKQRLKGPVGLFLTSHPLDETLEWFQSWSKKEYSRMGAKATRDIVLAEGTRSRLGNQMTFR